jgi:hypothetical protein
MKMSALRALLVTFLICVCNNLSLASEDHSGSGLTWKFEGGLGDVIYAFDVRMTAKDRWDPALKDAPPLLPGKAIRLAKDFLRNVPLGKDWSMWRMHTLRLLRSEDQDGLEEWLYVVDFYAANPRQGRSGPPDMSIPVRMDGTIPEPLVSKRGPKPSVGIPTAAPRR